MLIAPAPVMLWSVFASVCTSTTLTATIAPTAVSLPAASASPDVSEHGGVARVDRDVTARGEGCADEGDGLGEHDRDRDRGRDRGAALRSGLRDGRDVLRRDRAHGEVRAAGQGRAVRDRRGGVACREHVDRDGRADAGVATGARRLGRRGRGVHLEVLGAHRDVAGARGDDSARHLARSRWCGR